MAFPEMQEQARNLDRRRVEIAARIASLREMSGTAARHSRVASSMTT